MAWALLLIGVVATAEAFFHVPVLRHVRTMQTVAAKSFRTITSPKISDHHKETVLLAYAMRLLRASLALFLNLLLTMLPITCAVVIGTVFEQDVMALALTAPGIIISCTAALGYAAVRARHKYPAK